MPTRCCANTSPGSSARSTPSLARRAPAALRTPLRDHEGQPQPTLEDLQPLYQAVAHGCQAGLQQEACDKVYPTASARDGRSTARRNSARSVPTWEPSPASSRRPWSRRLARAHGSRPSLAAERSRLPPARLGPADRGPRADAGWAGDARQAGGLEERRGMRQQPERAGADAGRGGRGGGGRRAVRDLRRPQRRCVSAVWPSARPMPTPCTRRAAGPRRRRASARPRGCRPSASPTTRCSTRCRASCIATCSWRRRSVPRGR